MKRDVEERQLESNYDLDVAMHQLTPNKCNNSQIKKIYLNYRNILGIIILSDFHREGESEEGRRGPDLSPFEFNG
jgi:hypothetical protein